MGVYRALALFAIVPFYTTYLWQTGMGGSDSGLGTDSFSSVNTDGDIGDKFLDFMVSIIQTVTLVVFLVDWRLRCAVSDLANVRVVGNTCLCID